MLGLICVISVLVRSQRVILTVTGLAKVMIRLMSMRVFKSPRLRLDGNYGLWLSLLSLRVGLIVRDFKITMNF